MATVKRGKTGEITHIRVEDKFYTKADADKILHYPVSTNKFFDNLTARGKRNWFQRLVNGNVTVERMKIIILRDSGEIQEGID